MTDLAAIKARCGAATKGPWMVHIDTGSIDSPALDDPDDDWQVATAIRKEDREFIACARKDIPELVAETERLLEQAQRVSAEMEHLREGLRDIRAALKPPQQIESEAIIRGIDEDLAEKNPRQVYSENDMNVLRAILAGCRDSNTGLKSQIADLKADLARNARMLAQQCDQAREAEIQAAKAKREAADLREEVSSLRAAIEEVAIPSLLYCEKMYDHDDMARLNLEAALQLRERDESVDEQNEPPDWRGADSRLLEYIEHP